MSSIILVNSILKSGIVLVFVFLFSGLVFLGLVSCGEVVCFELEFPSNGTWIMSVPVLFDWYSLIFFLVVLLISACVMVYSVSYMQHEVYLKRFGDLVMLFVLSMSVYVFIPNFIGLMVGWDGLGLVSFLLVIYYRDHSSLMAGKRTFLTNRVGDALLILSLGLIIEFSTWGYFDLEEQLLGFFLIGLVVVGSTTKSAQFPFSAWLPDAMAAPTPVSALVHSSTLVTAGVFMLIRFSGCFSGVWSVYLLSVAGFTVVWAGVIGFNCMDLKKLVAFSTMSQLGLMMASLGCGAVKVCFFHLVVHAFFKALMFLCVGIVIFFSGGVQDFRLISGLWYKVPVSLSWLMICSFSLMGLPFMSGFYSKDLLLEMYYLGGGVISSLIILVFGVMFTSAYVLRFLWKLCSVEDFYVFRSSYEDGIYNMLPLFVLGICSLWVSYFLQMHMIDFCNYLVLSFSFKMLTLVCVVFGGLVFFVFQIFFEGVVVSSVGFVFKKVSLLILWFKSMSFLSFGSGDSLSSGFMFMAKSVVLVNVEKGWVENLFWGGGLGDSVYLVVSFVRSSLLKEIGVGMFFGVVFLFIIFG
uniref:NADH dehydrogenase subunit 5 n=1 Tax=Euglesa coreana TaxID=658622 RepID=UPI002236F4F3|nr:NADH dehydrogenase subunit 5 [Euglesa coreana]UYR45726.1 NADH dehydrogenase subunit 5 [Euglesa coreana]UYR45739.1 NADH dehydrogenase subunit 5 [Euglesa coreana]